MNTEHPSLQEIGDFLRSELTTENYPADEQGGIYYPSKRSIRRIGLALEPFPTLAEWIAEQHLDAIWLHRPWQLDLSTIPADIGVLSHHLPFDETMTVGHNRQLAHELGATSPPEPIGYKQSVTDDGTILPQRPLGMIVNVAEDEFDSWLTRIKELFGGYDRAEAGHLASGWNAESSRIAVVGAMTDALVREADGRGANMYLTGAYRKPAQVAVDETGIAVVAIGHQRSEVWGLQVLAELIHTRWPVECVIYM
ncbi:Nif3-like dinuclear metal center hexameric protein [Spirosoma sp. BT702]|uniref:Nif3-like dinuclear metal center hexameric protein n=1 Tax=Spirosoma profusum TaxID=2771354 RepID=A0A926Y186_9BACT|nr:Nif3-like dinuclear metal center hexameric protein [Spirosoma profusum]MBD2702077.1 Nif3-like dinuclear metal center hexameric protein [Spirosoma profusum]